MIEFFNKIFGRQPSGATAKERLRLVLMSDHLSLAPELIESMKRDLVDVISKYVEVDRDKIDVHFEHEDRGLAMLANIPITGVNRNHGNGSGGNKTEEPAGMRSAEDDAACQAEPVEAQSSKVAEPSNVPGQRRRKRRKGAQPGAAPQTGSPAPAT
jgi:cell division topological specificity factor